jgi:hypothetical protein
VLVLVVEVVGVAVVSEGGRTVMANLPRNQPDILVALMVVVVVAAKPLGMAQAFQNPTPMAADLGA